MGGMGSYTCMQLTDLFSLLVSREDHEEEDQQKLKEEQATSDNSMQSPGKG